MKKIINWGKKYWFFIFLILLVLFKQWLISELPIYARDYCGVDRWKLLRKAEDILTGNYWEGYTNETMFKRDVFFSIFLALCHLLNVSYWSAISLVYTASCLLSLYSFSLFCKKKIFLLIAFTIMLFSPISYSIWVQEVYNISLVVPLSISVISSLMIAFYYRLNEKKFFIWNILAGIFACMLWLNREDTQWLLILLGAYTVISLISTRRNIKRARTWGCIILPCFLVFLGNTTLSYLHYAHYGIWATNDHIATGFADAYNSLLKIAPDSYPESCSITRDMISRAAKESPSFAELFDWLDAYYEQNENMVLVGRAPDDGEIEDGWMPFVLRTAAYANGYYKDAISTDEYWTKVSQELETAFDEGRLEERSIFLFGNVLKHPWVRNQNYLEKWMSSCGQLLVGNVKHSYAVADFQYSTISSDIIKRYEAMTYDNAVEAPTNKLHISGWIILKDGNEFHLRLENDTEDIILSEIPLLESEDLLAFSDTYSVPLDKNRFDFCYEGEQSSYYLCLYNQDTIYKRIELNGQTSFDDNEILCYLERYENVQNNDPAEADARIKLQRLEALTALYNKLGFLMMIIIVFSYIGFCVFSVNFISKKSSHTNATDLWLYMNAIIGSILVYILAYGYINAFMFEATQYTAPVSGFLDYLAALSTISLPIIITNWRKGKTNDNRPMLDNME